ncbi:MAG: multidrug transporter [Legionellales bacterium RIFCSPHIGHO2_12_FULL_35_11]|nr:MAG: multidrug transporter [Legionellales bacterium RIFCSPHIGHO2_12_FULL_35_11]
MIKILKVSKHEINLPYIVLILGFIIIIFHIFSYYIPFTNNAFVATNVIPIAADVSGFISEIYVKNGQVVKQDQPLFKVYQKPYLLAYKSAVANYEQAIEKIKVIERQTQKTNELYKAAIYDFEKAKLKYKLKSSKNVVQAVPALEIKILKYELQSAEKKKNSLAKQIGVEDQQIIEQNKKVKSLKAEKNNALVNLNLTIVCAPSDGIVDNMYISQGTPIKIHMPVFSFIDTRNWWIQANFNETDLRRIRPGDKAIVILRMYYFNKIFKGEVVNNIWASDRQRTVRRTQQQKVANENEWLLIPQRLPLQIKILNPDPNYPLQPGSSAYVYLRANTHS